VNATLGVMLASQGEIDEARDLYAESVELHETLGLRFRAAVTALLGAEIELLAGEPAAAERELRQAYETLTEMGESGARGVVSAALALILAELGRDDEAWRFAELAEEISEQDDAFAAPLERAARARLLARRGDADGAEEVARRGVELAQATDSPMLQITALLALAEVVRPVDPAEARALLERAIRVCEAKGNVVEARRVAALLARAAATA
jgi:tetratricopeptide (TPR) repeat protein